MKKDLDVLFLGFFIVVTGVLIIILAHQFDEISELKRNVEDLHNRLELIENYNFNHSEIE